ncbi:MAG: threonine synthase, partial [Oscillospiraceae bacterium]|nr:threonine synthase [Oscillospiraceae bacterium]
EFSGGWCKNADSMKEIGKRWSDQGSLMDTHTAVASRVLADYRAETGSDAPCVIVSTASPYKFGGSVLEALGVRTAETGPALMELLAAETGIPAPAPLACLADKPVRFEKWVEVRDMEQAVAEFLA